jgi:carbonic anhydrase
MTSAREALDCLREGNARFASGTTERDVLASQDARIDALGGQKPIAVVLGCSDSRVPVELVFDQGLGDLFVIRVAGNIVGPSQIGSVEYALDEFETPLVVVLGHSGCGAVTATVDEITRPSEQRPHHVRAIVERIRPAVESLPGAEPGQDREALIREAVRANVRASTDALRRGSEHIADLLEEGGLAVVGAEYSLETGLVEFFEGVEERT